MTMSRPVRPRASLMACIVASVPVLENRMASGQSRALITFSAASTSRRWVMAKLVATPAASATASATAGSP